MTHYMLGGAKRRYKTVAPMVVVRVPGAAGGEMYIKGAGRMLPRGADPAHVESLVQLGLVAEVEVA